MDGSQETLECIRALATSLRTDIVVGASGVRNEEDVLVAKGAGAGLVLSPHSEPRIVRRARELGLASLPGVATPTEALSMMRHGASGLQAFPGELLPPGAMRAWRSFLPVGCLLVHGSDCGAEGMAEQLQAGVSGVRVAGVYRPGDTPEVAAARAKALVAACGGAAG